jgi:hypothetical protein
MPRRGGANKARIVQAFIPVWDCNQLLSWIEMLPSISGERWSTNSKNLQ